MNAWEALTKRYDYLTEQVSDPSLDHVKRQQLQKELSHLRGLLHKKQEVDQLHAELAKTQEDAQQVNDPELVQLYQEEVGALESKVRDADKALDLMMAPPNGVDERSAFLEIRAGTGGQEAALFVADLLKMYTNYALKKGWKVSLDSVSLTDLGGYREVVAHIQGHGAYGHLKFESGVHRVQRVPATETAGRVHTSTVTVAVFPEAEEVDMSINPADLKIDVFRAGGAGGQHVNKTESAVRITHIPSGVVVSCQDERSQHKNKAKALKILQSRLLAAHLEKQEAEMSRQRKEQVGTGKRSEKVRTYNYPQNRVTDHQVDVTLKSLDFFMLGDLDDVVDTLRAREHEQRKQEFLQRFLK